MISAESSTEPRIVQATLASARPALRIWLLGVLRVQVGARVVLDLARHSRAASLLKLLALAPTNRLHKEEVLDLLWPEFEPAAASNNLHRTLYALRRCLEPELRPGRSSSYVHLSNQTLLLRPPGPLWVDTHAFEVACTIASAAREPAAYEAALELYAQDLLPEDRYADWATIRRKSLQERYLGMLVELARVYEERAEPWSAIHALERAVAADPAHEDAHAGLMRLYAVVGQRHRALRQFERLREGLRRELEVEPDTTSFQLHAAIRDGRFPAGVRLASDDRRRGVVANVALSPREDQVATLLASGLTNHQIASTLGLSGRTAETHVRRILRKLGLGSRRDIAAWLTKRGLTAWILLDDSAIDVLGGFVLDVLAAV